MKLLEIEANQESYHTLRPVTENNLCYSFAWKKWLSLLANYSPYFKWYDNIDQIINDLMEASDKCKELQIPLKNKYLVIGTYKDSPKPNAEIRASFILTDNLPPEFQFISIINWRMDLE